jgi:hypothetical protein
MQSQKMIIPANTVFVFVSPDGQPMRVVREATDPETGLREVHFTSEDGRFHASALIDE